MMTSIRRTRCRCSAALLLALAPATLATEAAAEPFLLLRGAVVVDHDTRFEDAGGGSGGAVPYYGAGYATEAEIAAGAHVEAGLGWDFGHGLRLSASIGWLPERSISGTSNFLDGTSYAGTPERVTASVESWTAFADAELDLVSLAGWEGWTLRPFITAGLGVAWNRLDPMVFRFPALDQTTTTPGGDRTAFAWRAGAGLTVPVDDRLAVDFTWRYTDLGVVGTDAGEITVERPSGTSRVTVGKTEADLASHTFGLTLRWSF